jgi:hypothetical protein
MVAGERATVKERVIMYMGGEGEEINWPFLGPPVGHWDDARKLPVGGQGYKELTGAGPEKDI